MRGTPHLKMFQRKSVSGSLYDYKRSGYINARECYDKVSDS